METGNVMEAAKIHSLSKTFDKTGNITSKDLDAVRSGNYKRSLDKAKDNPAWQSSVNKYLDSGAGLTEAIERARQNVSKLPSFDTGGEVPGAKGSPQLIMAHGGETVLPTHKNNYSTGIDYDRLGQAVAAALQGAKVEGEVTVNIEQGSGKMRQFRLAF